MTPGNNRQVPYPATGIRRQHLQLLKRLRKHKDEGAYSTTFDNSMNGCRYDHGGSRGREGSEEETENQDRIGRKVGSVRTP